MMLHRSRESVVLQKASGRLRKIISEDKRLAKCLVAKVHFILSEAELLRASFDVGYFFPTCRVFI
jgi:hypothetical protein